MHSASVTTTNSLAQFLQKAIAQHKTNAGAGQEQDIQIAKSCVKLAKVYYKVTRFFEAEALYLSALDLYKAYDSDAIDDVDVDIARTSLELGDLYYMINRHEDARKLFLDAYHKYSELVSSGSKRYTASLAEACNKLAYLDIAVYSHRKTEHYYVHALKVKQLLTPMDPVVYFLFLERICRKLGHLWKGNCNQEFGNLVLHEADRIKSMIQNKAYSEEKEEYRAMDYSYYEQPINKPFLESLLMESLQHYKILADENPEAYEPSLAQTYNGRVCCCDNASENYLGYSTFGGDDLGAFSPLGNLTVTEIRALGKELGLPDEFVLKIPDDGLPNSSPDEVKFGFTYEMLDKYIREGVCEDDAIREKIDEMHAKSQFKRNIIRVPAFNPWQ